MIKLLIGGSPCTFWSIAQKKNRETKAEGLGWELFKNYLIAKEKFKPEFFLYENNKSAAQAIKNKIKEELNVWDGSFLMEDSGARYIEINSALVSAQNRQRFYVHNCGDVEQPEERGILLQDILDTGCAATEKSYCLTHLSGNTRDYFKKHHTQLAFEPIAVPVRIGDIESNAQAHRVYSCNGKSVTINSGGGGQGGKTGLYLCPIPDELIGLVCDKGKVYEVKNGIINVKFGEFPIELPDGHYVIRKLSPVECERLQTLPDNYTAAVSNSQRYKGLGNGWTAEVIIHILNSALKDVSRNEKIVVLSMYDGIGTGRYCLDKMGFTNVKYYAYEIDKYAKQISMSNYPDIIQMGDAFDLRNPDWAISIE